MNKERESEAETQGRGDERASKFAVWRGECVCVYGKERRGERRGEGRKEGEKKAREEKTTFDLRHEDEEDSQKAVL